MRKPKGPKKTSISGQKPRSYSRFLHTVKTSLLRSARSLDDVAPNVRPQAEIKLHFRAPSPSWKLPVLKVPTMTARTPLVVSLTEMHFNEKAGYVNIRVRLEINFTPYCSWAKLIIIEHSEHSSRLDFLEEVRRSQKESLFQFRVSFICLFTYLFISFIYLFICFWGRRGQRFLFAVLVHIIQQL